MVCDIKRFQCSSVAGGSVANSFWEVLGSFDLSWSPGQTAGQQRMGLGNLYLWFHIEPAEDGAI